MGEPISTTAMIGMAVAAAGAAMQTANTVAKRQQMGDIADRTRAKVEAERKKALGAWEQGLNKLTPEEQRKAIEEETAKRQAAYEAAAADRPPEMNVIHTDASTPAIVKTEAAKQLGQKLDVARAQLAGQAKMSGFDANTWLQNLGLTDTGRKVGMGANFMSGWQNAGQTDAANVMGGTSTGAQLGDLLSAAGSTMMSVPAGKAAPTPQSWTADPRVPPNWYRAL
jgi:hypothetical protein